MIYRTILGYLTRKAIIAPKPWDKNSEESPYKAVQNFTQEHLRTLTNDSLQSLQHYGANGHGMINQHLRGDYIRHGPYRKEVEKHITNIDTAMGHSILNSDIIVWRGIAALATHALGLHLYLLNAIKILMYGEIDVINDGNLQKAVGFTFTEPGYISTTLNRGIDLVQYAPIVLRIHVKTGQHAIYMNAIHALTPKTDKPDIKEFRGLRDEHEVLLDRGMTFKVTNIQSNKKNQVTVSLEVV